MNLGITNTLLSSSSYFNTAIVPNTITINTIKFFITAPLTSATTCRWAIFKGSVRSDSILQGQASSTIPSSTEGVYTMTFTVESGKSLTFNQGDVLILGYCCNNISVQTFVTTGNSDFDTCFLVSTDYSIIGFPALLVTTSLTRVQTNIHLCACFFT